MIHREKSTEMKRLTVWTVALLMLLMFLSGASAETERGNLNERFDDEITVVYGETEYRLRSRMTTIVFVGAVKDEAELCYRSEMLVLLAVDDNRKLITPVMIDEGILSAPIEISFAGEETGTGLPALTDIEEQCDAIVQTANALLPAETVEHYVVLDLAGLETIDGKRSDDYEERMREIKNRAERMSTSQVSDLLAQLSGYLATDMKSGEFIRIIDKAERYDRRTMERMKTAESWTEEEENAVIYTPEGFLEWAIETFFQEKTGW